MILKASEKLPMKFSKGKRKHPHILHRNKSTTSFQFSIGKKDNPSVIHKYFKILQKN